MATLAAQMRSDMVDVFLNTDEHAVPVVYTPAATGTPKSITGIIDPIEDADIAVQSDGRGISRAVSFVFYDDSTDGIARPVAGDQFYVNLPSHPLNAVVFKVSTSRPDGHGAHYGTGMAYANFEKSAAGFRIERGR